MSLSGRRLTVAAVAVAALAAAGLGTYFIADGRAKDGRKSTQGPPPVSVTVEPATQATVPVRLQAVGNVEAYTTVTVKSRVDGQIVQVHFREGQEVKKGEVLFRIDSRPFDASLKQAEAQAARDVASRDQAASQERRYQDLLDKNFVSKDAYAQYRTNAQTAEATSKASQAALESARLNLEYTVIRSPIDGYVGRALLQAGNMVKANDTLSLVVINQVKPVYVTFAIPEQELATVRERLRQGPLQVEAVAAGDNRPITVGRVAFLDNAVDQTTGTIKVRAIFDNADAALWPGQFYTVRVRLYEQTDAILLPSRALQTGPNGQFVYVVKPDMTVEVRKVVVARIEGDYAVLAGNGGVARDEKVVTRGALRLAPGARVSIVESAPAS